MAKGCNNVLIFAIIEHMGHLRKILHVDLDAFFCAVEEQLNPALKGKAFAVGGDPGHRSVVSSCSYPARKLGIHSAMPMIQALRICPSLMIVHSGFHFYQEKSESVMSVLRNWTPFMEQVSVDEAFLDVSDLPGENRQIALAIQSEIHAKTALPCSLGAASNKLVAKVANTMGKKQAKKGTYPNSIHCIENGEEAAFLSPLPVRELWGIGDKTEQLLQNRGIYRIGQLAAWPVDQLEKIFGINAAEIHDRANGIDTSPVNPDPAPAKSVSQETTFFHDVTDEAALRKKILQQSEQVGFRLRQMNLRGDTVRLKVRWDNFVTISRQVKVGQKICQDSVINEQAQKLFSEIWSHDPRPVRLIGLAVSGIEDEAEQLSFFQPSSEKEDRLLQAVDQIRNKYGKKSLKRGIDL